MRAHRNLLSDGRIVPGVFRAQGAGMSFDWSKYSSPEQTRLRAKKPPDNVVIALIVGEIRTQVKLPVLHKPDPENQSHSEVTFPENGEDLTEARVKLGRIAKVAIPLSI